MSRLRNGSRFALLACVAVAPMGAAAATTPRTLNVPNDYPTIQAAVDAARLGDTVFVTGGDYRESVRIVDRSGLTIRGDLSAKIDGGVDVPAITVVRGDSITVTGLRLVSGSDALRLESTSKPTVRGVRVLSAGGDGIHAEGIEGDILIDANQVQFVTGSGISIAAASPYRAGLAITGNTIHAAGQDGIFAYSAEDRGVINVSGNHIEGAGWRGIRTDCGYADVRGNDIAHTGHDAISVYRTRSEGTVADNVIRDSAGAGIRFEDTPTSVVTGNDIGLTKGDGIVVDGPAVFIRDNTVADTGGAGVRSTAVEAHFVQVGNAIGQSIGGNLIERSAEAGIVVADAIGVSIDENHVVDAGGSAIDVSGDQLVVTGNTISSPADDGIVVENLGGQRGVRVIGNEIEDASVDGVDLGASDGVLVSGNHVTGSGDCGFRVGDGASRNQFKKNVASECGSYGLMESDAAGKNGFAKSNRFGRSHRRARHNR